MLTAIDDNVQSCIPFKGPFKGKGQNRRAIRELKKELAQIRSEMDQLIEVYNETFQRPRPINLRLLQRANTFPIMWWRAAVRSGPFIQLFNDPRGQVILSKLGPNTVRVLRDFDQQRLNLNFRSKVVGGALEGFEIYERGMAQLEKVVP